MSDSKYSFVRNFINKGNKRIVDEIDAEFQRLVNDSRCRIREDFSTGPVETFRCWLEEMAEEFKIINHNTVCNDNNNTGQDLPVHVTIRYRRKDSFHPTTMNYTITEKTADEKAKDDKFARWRK